MALAPRSHCSIHSATFTLHLCSYIHAAARVLQRSHSFFNTTAFVQQLVLPLSRHHTYDAPHMQQHFGSSIHAASLTLLLFCHGILRLCSRIEAFTLQLSRNPSAGGRGLLWVHLLTLTPAGGISIHKHVSMYHIYAYQLLDIYIQYFIY